MNDQLTIHNQLDEPQLLWQPPGEYIYEMIF